VSDYRPVFFTKPRNGEVSVWVNMPGDYDQNICDVKSLPEDVKKIIAFSFKLGMKAGLEQVRSIRTPFLFETEKFEERQ